MTSNLHGKNILVFAATGAIAGRAATKFAAAGAHVWVSGHDGERLQSLVEEIRSADGVVNCDEVDATDANAVADYVTRVAAQTGHIDGVFNGIGGRPAGLKYPAVSVTQPIDDFMVPLQRIVGSQFLSAREAAKHMTTQPNGGSIVLLSATLSGMTAPFMAGISATQGAIEAMGRSLAGEFGPGGVRVNTVRGSAMPETRTIQETGAGQMAISDSAPPMAMPPLGRPITVDETVNTAAFLLSDDASGMTGQVVTVCAGAFV